MTTFVTLSELIAERIASLNIDRPSLVGRLGYADVRKGLNHLEDLLSGLENTERSRRLIRALPEALEIEPSQLHDAIEASRAANAAAQDAQYRRAFSPHGMVVTERDRPSQIFVAALTGAISRMRITIEDLSDPDSFSEQVRVNLPDFIPAFGRVTGYIVNYSPDHAIEFDLSGAPVRELDEAIRLGAATLWLGKRQWL